MRTGSVETPVERSGNRPLTTSPFVVMPLNGSARPCSSAARDIAGKRATRSLCANAAEPSIELATRSRASFLSGRRMGADYCTRLFARVRDPPGLHPLAVLLLLGHCEHLGVAVEAPDRAQHQVLA